MTSGVYPRWTAVAAKFAAVLLLVVAVAAIGCALALLSADHFLGADAPTLDADRWILGARGVAYLILTGLLAFGLTIVMRSALIPLIYLVANSTVVSVGYLLAHLTSLAWYLPDTSGMSLVRIPPETGQPSALVGGLVMSLWVASALLAAALIHARRDIR